MKKMNAIFNLLLLVSGAIFSNFVLAAPGEDPVMLTGRVNYMQFPTARPAGSSNIVYRQNLPDNAKAKIARYIARSYSPDTSGIQTEKDVVSAVQTNATRTTCVQTLAPAGNGSPAASSDQVVVIRGDLVNICR
ncbi:hypothetical protein [Oryzisolibacter propanilivorax]|uniref:hypothetical protein n=1 Tax=Oryzisolibacter propanilivorax TaxID=1527607 RepID=UPI0011143CBC|nr:hypothetical protein [Oryzisolibacter propanilivorax]